MRSARTLARQALLWAVAGSRTAPVSAAPQRILVLEPGHLGDVLLLTPALHALRAALPEAWITVLVGPWALRLLAHNPALNHVAACAFPGFVRGAQPAPWQPYALLARTALLLRAARFDTALIARDDHWWGALLARAAGIPRRIGTAHPAAAPLLTTALPYAPTEHVTSQRLAQVAALTGTAAAAPATCFFPTAAEHAWAAAWIAEHAPQRPLLAIQPGSGGAAKLWPADRWAAVAQQLAERAEIVVTGGPADAEPCAALTRALEAVGVRHHGLVGATNLGQLAALFARCAAVAGVDNGPLHLAVSQGVPTVHLFGPGDAGRFGPWGPAERHQVLRAPLWCAPCGVLDRCPRGTAPSECMALLSVAQVTAALQRALAART